VPFYLTACQFLALISKYSQLFFLILSYNSHSSSAKVKERVELYLCSPSGLPWSVLGRILPLTFALQYGTFDVLIAVSANYRLLGCVSVLSGKNLRLICNNLVLPSSGRKTEAVHCSQTRRTTLRHIPEDGSLHPHNSLSS
jgi:hypothetical protein